MHLSPGPRPQHRPLSDAALTSAVRKGRVELFRYLYRRHYAAVQAYASQCMAGPVQAHEVTSFVFAQILQRIVSGESFADGRHPGCLRRQLLDAVRTTAITHSQREEEALSPDFRAWVAAGSVWPWGEDGQLGLAYQRLAPTTQCLLWHALVDRDDASLTARVTGLAPGAVQAGSEEARGALREARMHLYLERMGPRHCADSVRRLALEGGSGPGTGRGGAHHPRACRGCHGALSDLARLDAQLDMQLPVRLLGWWPGEFYLRAKAAIQVPLSDPPFLARLLDRAAQQAPARTRPARRVMAAAVSARRGQEEPVAPVAPAASRPASHRTPRRNARHPAPGSEEGARRSPATVAVVGFLAGIAVGMAALSSCGHQDRPHQLLPGDTSSVPDPPGTPASGPDAEAPGAYAATPGGYALRPVPYAMRPDGEAEGPDGEAEGPDGNEMTPDGYAVRPASYAVPRDGRAVRPDVNAASPHANTAAPNGSTKPGPSATVPGPDAGPGDGPRDLAGPPSAAVPTAGRHRYTRRGRSDDTPLPRPDSASGLSADDSSPERSQDAGWGTRARIPLPDVQSSVPPSC
ncbi:hypothetical protein [Streptomyces sp. NPDC048639]|uniref:RNA polymerase sigma factor n=1 Tax=Streptomyces sp. NPDC048639 TaxID=3365581 RepID=UPI00371E80FC